MRILRVIPSLDPITGGPCQGIRNSIPALQELGIANEVVSFDLPDAEFLSSESFPIHALGPAWGLYSYSSKLYKWLTINLKRFDAVIIHGLWQYHSYGTYYAFRDFRNRVSHEIKLFVMPHGMLDPYFQRARSRRLKAVRNYFFWKGIEHRVVNGADALLFTCERELQLAREPFSPYAPRAEYNVGYGIQSPPPYQEKFSNAFFEKCPAVAGKPYFLFLSRIHPKKGVDLLIKAYLRLKREFTNIPDLVIAGPGMETPFGSALQELVQTNAVHFTGMLHGVAKWGAFYNCENFVLPSHQENFGIAVVEALACAKPVLISDQVNIYREIEDGSAGLIGADMEIEIYKMLKTWINFGEEEKQEMGRNAYKVYESNFTVGNAAARMLKAILETITEKEKVL